MTKQRKAILEILRSTDSHPTADWIYEQVRKIIPNISLGTIYRNLSILKDMGEIMELSFGSTYSRYDGNPKNHYHFCCFECNRVYDIDIPVLQTINEEVSNKTGNIVHHHRLEFYGICKNCQEKN
ncbi:transcriptional repressor [Anoxybacter fermentans]|uniref:Transcriptional repressor n=1 Tax=Anoxybacter fermentans TaxID=1323375 RepID=A0A3Q9HTE9_9FIRM|nr:transcriptional repressor [Anoxybacter fermentans]